jgi:hypothetical protein
MVRARVGHKAEVRLALTTMRQSGRTATAGTRRKTHRRSRHRPRRGKSVPCVLPETTANLGSASTSGGAPLLAMTQRIALCRPTGNVVCCRARGRSASVNRRARARPAMGSTTTATRSSMTETRVRSRGKFASMPLACVRPRMTATGSAWILAPTPRTAGHVTGAVRGPAPPVSVTVRRARPPASSPREACRVSTSRRTRTRAVLAVMHAVRWRRASLGFALAMA